MGIVSGGGGGSFNGGTITGNLDVRVPSSAHVNVGIDSDPNAKVSAGVADAGAGAKDAALDIEADGGGVAQMYVTNHSAAGTGVTADGRGLITLFTTAATKGIEAWDDAGNVLRFALLPTAGQIMTGVTTVPPDGDLAAGQLALWFDPTNGAAKLMAKAKQANGTVVTAAVALA